MSESQSMIVVKRTISMYRSLTGFCQIPELLDSLDCWYCYFLRHHTIHTEETVLFAEAKRR